MGVVELDDIRLLKPSMKWQHPRRRVEEVRETQPIRHLTTEPVKDPESVRSNQPNVAVVLQGFPSYEHPGADAQPLETNMRPVGSP